MVKSGIVGRMAMSSKLVEEALSAEIRNIALISEADADIVLDEDFLVSGLIDSFGFIALLKFVEERYGIVIEEDDQFDDRLRTVRGMASFVKEKLDGT
jgi:acyl carrier protein